MMFENCNLFTFANTTTEHIITKVNTHTHIVTGSTEYVL